VDIDFNSNDEVYDIGDLVGATDDTTGISVVQKITKKIVTIDDRGAIVKCKIDSGKYSKASLESGKESVSAKDIDDIKALIGTSDISKYGKDVKDAIVEIGSKADNIADDNDEYNPNHNYVVGEYCISPDDGTLQKCVVATSGGSWATVKDTCFTKDSLANVVKTLNNDLTNSNDRIENLEAIALSETRVAINCNTAVSGITPFGYKGTSLPVSSSANNVIYAVTVEKPSSGDWVFSIDVNQTNRTITVYANGSAILYADVIYKYIK
jgi:hypothetical protein